MALIEKFEEIRAWQEARILTQQIYAPTRNGQLSKDFGLRDQLQRASVSVMANIAEGFDCDSHKEFARFLGIARRSAVEVQSPLYICLVLHYITHQQFDTSYQQALKAKRTVHALKQSVEKRANTT